MVYLGMQKVEVYNESNGACIFTLHYIPEIQEVGRDNLIWIFPDGYYKIISMSRDGYKIYTEPYILGDTHIKTPLQLIEAI